MNPLMYNIWLKAYTVFVIIFDSCFQGIREVKRFSDTDVLGMFLSLSLSDYILS